MCEQLRKRKMDTNCLQEVRWRVQGVRFVAIKGTARDISCGYLKITME